MSLPRPHPDVVARALPDGAVLFHPVTEVYFGLNESGLVVWEQLASAPGDVLAIVDALIARWPDVPRATLEADVRHLLDELLVQGLLISNAEVV
jgi:hypothetical protein